MKKFMRVGLVHFMAFPTTIKGEGSIEETVRRIACDDYFDAIEVTWIKDSQVRQSVKKITETANMTVCYGSQPRLLTTGLNINDLNEDGREKAISTLKEGIDEAYELGAKGFAFLSGKFHAETIEASYNALVKSTKILCEYAKSKADMPIILEIFDYDIDKKSLIGPTSLALKFAKEIREEYDNFGLMVDLSHIPMYHESCKSAIEPIKEYIVHAHIGNTIISDPTLPAYGDTHPRFGFPSSENNIDDIVIFLRTLLHAGILNEKNPPVVSFEVKPWLDEDPELVISNAKRALNRAWSLV